MDTSTYPPEWNHVTLCKCAALFVLAAALPGAAAAQRAPWGTSHLTVAGVNVMVGGVAAAAVALVSGEPVGPAFLGGAAGGLVVYGGKRVAATRKTGAGFAGRQLAAVGGSMIRNAGAGQRPLHELVLPAWPLRIYLRPGGASRVKVDGATTAAALYFAIVNKATPDVGLSLSTGALVMRADPGDLRRIGDMVATGESAAGVLIMDRSRTDDALRLLTAHELVHVLQFDQVMLTIGEPAERGLARLHPWLRAVQERVDLGLIGGLHFLGNDLLEYHDRPWEWEADFLTTGRAQDGPMILPGR